MSTSAQRVSKENFRLLDLSTSEEDSEDLHLEIAPTRKKKATRRERNRSTAPQGQELRVGASELRCAVRWAIRIALLIWLVTLSWLTIALYDQITTMRMELSKVTTSSNGVEDSLQLCHTAAKELRNNASDLNDRLVKLEKAHRDLVMRVDQATGDLAAVADQLAAAPKLADTPRRLAELQRTVADFGSQINGFDSALTSARNQALSATTGLEEVKASLHELEARTNETVANSTLNSQKDEVLRQQISALNSTVYARIDSLQASILDFTRTSSTVAPSTAASPTTVASKPTTTPIPTTTTAPDLPAKPIVTL